MTRVRITIPVATVLRQFLDEPGKAQYGLRLMRKCELPSGSLYPILKRLEHAGWITGRFEEVDPVKAGRPPRRYYLLTNQGHTNAARELATLSSQFTTAAVPRQTPSDPPHPTSTTTDPTESNQTATPPTS